MRIEIVDPATDLPLTGAAPVTAVADESPVRHPLERLEPVRRRLTAVSWWLARRRMQRISNGDPRRNSTVRRH